MLTRQKLQGTGQKSQSKMLNITAVVRSMMISDLLDATATQVIPDLLCCEGTRTNFSTSILDAETAHSEEK